MGRDVSEQGSAIRRRQNDPTLRTLLRAMSASHARAERLDAASTAVSVVVAMGGFIATFVPTVAGPITVVGAVWALICSTGLASWTDAELRRAATIQEMFDVRLFALPWNPVLAGEPVDPADVSRLSSHFRGDEDMLVDYYEIQDFPSPYDVVACQMMNLGWGARVRMRFAYSIVAIILAWSFAGTVAGAVVDVTVAQLLLGFYVPSLGGLMLGLDMVRRQHAVVRDRQRVLQHLRASVGMAVRDGPPAGATATVRVLTRQVQDAIFLTRLLCPRVPHWFFLRFRARDRIDFIADMEDLQSMITGRGRAGW
jgi:hypothetical protein